MSTHPSPLAKASKKGPTTFRISRKGITALKDAAHGEGSTDYSPILERLLVREIPRLAQQVARPDVRTAKVERGDRETVTFYLTIRTARRIKQLAFLLGYRRYSDLVAEIVDRRLVRLEEPPTTTTVKRRSPRAKMTAHAASSSAPGSPFPE